MSKKLLTVILTISMVLSLAACGNDKKDSGETDTMNAVAEETSAAEAAEKPSIEETTEEPVAEDATVEETKTTEYQLTQMDTGFFGGIAWATIATDAGAKKVLINKDLQIVYELPEGMETGDIFDGKAVVLYSDQASNPGFMILGADGSVLYECTDNLGDKYSRVVSLTKDGGAVYEKLESGLTGLTYACVLNDKFEMVAQIEKTYAEVTGDCYFYLSDGVYGYEGSEHLYFILNAKDNMFIAGSNPQSGLPCSVQWDADRCVGFKYENNNINMAVNAECLDYSTITDWSTFVDAFNANARRIESSRFPFYFLHSGYISYDDSYNNIEGFAVPDFGAEIIRFSISNDGKYLALLLKGADYNNYYTVINSDGQVLYEPMTSDQLFYSLPSLPSWNETTYWVFDGYIMDMEGNGITPDGKVFQLGDGTALSGVGENTVAYIGDDSGYDRPFRLSDGYIVCQNKLYGLDGTEVTTVTADASLGAESGKEDVQDTSAANTGELIADGCGGLYSGSQQGQYYYVWLEMGSLTSSESPAGTIRLLWEGNEPYAEGSELSQDAPHDFYMGDVDDAYMIKPGWNNEDASILTIDQDEFGEYSGKIFCFGFWMEKDDSLIYDGTSLRYRN